MRNHEHFALADPTSSPVIELQGVKGAKIMLIDIACGSISGIVNHSIGHPIE